MAVPAGPPRLRFLDDLRAGAVVLVVVLHASITYMTYAPEWWYVIDPHRTLLLTGVVLLLDVPLMPALFFVAGYFAIPSLQRRGPGGFVREKTIRLGIPWVVGVVFLAPVATYMTYVSRDVPTGYLEFWTTDFWGPLYQQAVYWFLGVLFAAFLVLAWMWGSDPERLAASEPRPEQPRPLVFVTVAAGTAAWGILVAPSTGPDDWQHLGWLFVIQPARVAFYVGYFALGVYAERRAWFGAAGYRPDPWPWGWACAITGVVYLGWRFAGYPTTVGERSLTAVLFAVYCLTAVIAGIALTQRIGDRAGRTRRTVASNAYGIYYVHPLILYPLAYLLVDVDAPAVVKAALLVALTLTLSLAASELALRRLPGLRRAFRP